uniref:Transmembrane protein 186 n=1 Tax=Timema genevievae TaxID=629358 RepID=A0A7R9JX13_TIMGE|nr:unnamed protein product [Timema genevievae]
MPPRLTLPEHTRLPLSYPRVSDHDVSVVVTSTTSTSYPPSLFSCVTLYTLGIVCNRIVGAIYVTPDAKTVKFSYLDFWGRRNDIICPVTDVLPLSELEGRITDPYIDLRQYSTPKKLRFSIRLILPIACPQESDTSCDAWTLTVLTPATWRCGSSNSAMNYPWAMGELA